MAITKSAKKALRQNAKRKAHNIIYKDNIKKLVNHAIRIKNRSLIKRLGFILEENKLECEKLEKFVDNSYTTLDLALGKKGKKNKKWKIIDNRK